MSLRVNSCLPSHHPATFPTTDLLNPGNDADNAILRNSVAHSLLQKYMVPHRATPQSLRAPPHTHFGITLTSSCSTSSSSSNSNNSSINSGSSAGVVVIVVSIVIEE
jgi:hypothetical protein